jgi:hypothetical protein
VSASVTFGPNVERLAAPPTGGIPVLRPDGLRADETTVRRNGRTLAVCTILAGVLAGVAHAAPGLLVGVSDDSLKWTDKTQAQSAIADAHDLGFRAVRVTVPWHPGETRLSLDDRRPVDRMILATWAGGLRVVLAVYGQADDAPQTDTGRDTYCTFAASLLRRYPGVNDVVIWNEPNSGRFWRPQFAPDGSSLAPSSYEQLLARCWDTLHAVRASANVIAASAARGNDDPAATSPSHSPASFYREIGAAYRESGRTRPILDTVGHNPYPATNAEPPWTRHTNSKVIGEGDYDRLMTVLQESFGGTGQPVPGEGRVSIWYMEQGFQTTVDPAKSSLYQGTENERQLLSPLAQVDANANGGGAAPDQATQLADALDLAYCQPGVAAFFNFELADETDLAGWQSGLLWADGTPKPSYQPFKTAVRTVAARQVDCERYSKLAAGSGAEVGFSTSTYRSGRKPSP